MAGSSRVRAGDLTQDNEQAVVESFCDPSDTIPPGIQAAGRPLKRREPPLDIREAKRTKSLVIGGDSDPSDACDVHQSQGSSEESELPSSSRQLTETALGNVKFDRGCPENEHFRPLEVDVEKHKIFLSHSGAQKPFVEQLCVDLERGGCIDPFFDQRERTLKEEDVLIHSLIKEKAAFRWARNLLHASKRQPNNVKLPW